MKRTLLLLVILCCFATSGWSQKDPERIINLRNQLEILKVDTPGLDETLNINISQTSVSNFLLAISKVHNLNINVASELESVTIINHFPNVAVSDILIFLVKEYGLDIDFTGNIMSFSRYVEPPAELTEKPINAVYTPATGLMNLDLKNDRLEKVFRKIMDVSGKNLLYSPEIEATPLTLYLNDVPFDIALQKLAESNNLILNKSRDGFYVFDAAFVNNTTGGEGAVASRPTRRPRTAFYYQILDTLTRKVSVDFQNTPVADVIYTLGEDLKLDIFTASPLDNAGMATVTAEDISFDLLLDKIFESGPGSATSVSEGSNGRSEGTPVRYTYKKDGDMYYFGTEDQLSLKQIEMVTLMHRSIKQLSNPSGTGQRRAGRTNVNTSFTNFNTLGGNSNFNNRNQNNVPGGSTRTNTESEITSIEEIIPADIKDGLEITVDAELNSFIVSGPGVKVERFKNFVKNIDKPVPVILIEVMILEVNRSAIVETGISFGLGEEPSKTVGAVYPSTDIRLGADQVNRIIGSFDGFGSLNLGKVVPEFYLDIKAMESNGFIKVLSTPKLSTINGHKAYLSSGQTSYYAITQQNFFGAQVPATSEITNYVPIDAELAIEIMPFVAGDGEITLDIQVIQSAFNGERIAEDAPPGINSREFSSIIRMRDQDVAILGGIEETRKDDSGSGVPLLARIPVIKWLFSKKRREDTKRKLNVLIKPTVIY